MKHQNLSKMKNQKTKYAFQYCFTLSKDNDWLESGLHFQY